MRGLNKYKLDNIIIEKGIQHDSISADILLDQVKIGEILNDGWCDEFFIELETEELLQEFRKTAMNFYKKHKIESTSLDYAARHLLFRNREYRSVHNNELKCDQFSFIWV